MYFHLVSAKFPANYLRVEGNQAFSLIIDTLKTKKKLKNNS